MTDSDLASRIAEVAADPVAVPAQTQAMVINRIIDNAAVSAASVGDHLVSGVRAQARAHRTTPGATIFGIDGTFSPEWAAFANGVAVHHLELNDAVGADQPTHPGGVIPALVAVGQHTGLRGVDLIRGIATAYEIQVRLTTADSTVDHGALLGTSVAAGLGTMLRLPSPTIRAAIEHAVHLTGVRHTPAYAGKLAVDAVDRAMRGGDAPPPSALEQIDGVALPDTGEPKQAILASYPRQHSAHCHGQVAIDLALRLHHRVGRVSDIESVVLHTGHDTHVQLGSGADDPDKFDPDAPREVLSRSLMYLFAVALEDGQWHHERSYTCERAHRPETVALWRSISTVETAGVQACTVRAVITLRSGEVIVDELAVAHAHPAGAHPFTRNDYVAKFALLTDGVIDRREQQRFLDVAVCLSELRRGALGMLNPLVDRRILDDAPTTYGIYR